MDIFGIGIPELLVILVLAMVAVGPEKMVEYSGKAGKWFAQFRRETSEVTKEFKDALEGVVQDAEIEELSEKNKTPTQWRFTPTQFAIPDKKANTTASSSVPSKKPASVRDKSDEEAIALLESLSNEQDGAVSVESAPTSVAESAPEPAVTVQQPPVDEVLAIAAAEKAVVSRSTRTSTKVTQPASTPTPKPAAPPVSVPDGDISDLLGSAFGLDEEPKRQESESTVEPQSAVATESKPAQAPAPQTPPTRVKTVEKPAQSSPTDSDDPLDALGDALSFSFSDDQDEGGR